MDRSLIVLLLVFLAWSEGRAQTYLKVIGEPGRNERGFVAHRSPADELYIGGSVNDSALVQRIDADGNVLWSRSFKPPGQYDKNVVHLASAPDGSLLGCGNGYNPTGEPVEGFHFRMDNSGGMLWVRYWDEPLIYEQRIQAISALEYIMFGGYFDSTTPDFSDVLTARIDAATGDITWLSDRLDQHAPVPYISDMGSVTRIGDSYYAACSIFTNGPALSTRRAGMSKFDATGQHQNTQYFLFPNTDDRRMVTPDIIATNDSLTLAYFGDTNGSSTNFTQGLIRMDTLGNVAWARDFNVGGSTREQNTKVVATSFGYVIAGRTMATNPVRLFLMAVSNNGLLLWTKSYGQTTQSQTIQNLFASNLVDLGDGFLLTGTVDQGGGEFDLLLIRTDINGDIECSDVNPMSALTTVLPELSFASPVQETPIVAALGSDPVVTVDAVVNDVCVLVVSLGNDTSLCGSLQLDAGVTNATYEWQDGSTAQTFEVTSSGTYWVRVNQDCCLATDTIEVQIDGSGPGPDLGPDTAICAGETLLLSTTLGGPYEWQDGSTDAEFLVTEPGTYWLLVGPPGCTTSDTIVVQESAPIDIELGPDTAICANDILFLEPPLYPGDYLWSDGSTDVNFLILEPGTYWLQITDGGCVARDTIVVSTLEVPTVAFGPDTASCAGDPILLSPEVVGADQYLWNDGSDGVELLAPVSGVYWLNVGNYCGFNTDSIAVTIAEPITVDLGPDTLVCVGSDLVFALDLPGWTITWSDGSTGNTLAVDSAGQYWVDVVDGLCAYTDTVNVEQLTAATVAMPADTTVCDGGPYVIVPDLSNAETLLWSDGSDLPELAVTVTGSYTLDVSNACGSASASITVQVISAPQDLGADTLLCIPDSLVLDRSDVDGSLLWSDGSTGTTFIITAPGEYWLEGTVQTCVYRDTIIVDYTEIAELDLGPDTVLCEVPAYILDAGDDGDAAEWSDGSIGRFLFVSSAGNYAAEITNYCGTVADTVRLDFAMPVAPLTDVSLCPGNKAVLDPQGELLTIAWSTGDTVFTIEVGEGEYSYEAEDIVGCPHTDDVRVFIDSGSDGQVYIPNAFSPNGDGFNEVFTVSGPERSEFEMVIFDRWGEELYRTDNPYKGWDGTTGGAVAMNDVHVYVVTYKDRCQGGAKVTKRGHVTLLR
jgi:gliding motility-associated-like protein